MQPSGNKSRRLYKAQGPPFSRRPLIYLEPRRLEPSRGNFYHAPVPRPSLHTTRNGQVEKISFRVGQALAPGRDEHPRRGLEEAIERNRTRPGDIGGATCEVSASAHPPNLFVVFGAPVAAGYHKRRRQYRPQSVEKERLGAGYFHLAAAGAAKLIQTEALHPRFHVLGLNVT